jgi:peptidoglycan/xylan/chitin deacetylase (PgdA/CDA1 family)
MRSSDLRWVLKKSARKTVAVASGVLHGRSQGPSIRVLTYHRFGDAPHDPFCVRVADFEGHMATLARLGLAVSLADVEAFLAGTRVLADGSVLVTIDDGCPSTLVHAAPILRRHGVPAVAFVPTGEIGDQRSARDTIQQHPDDRLSWRELVELRDWGIVVGSHAWSHQSLGRMPLAAVREQATRSREALESRLGQPVTAFAYPFGTLADFTAETADVIRESGYSCAFTSQHGAIRADADRFALPRVKIEGGEDLWMFEASIRGGLDAWRWIDRTLWRMQASGG